MTKTAVALLALGTVMSFAAPQAASARDYAYCLQGRQWGYPGNCQFSTYQQCQATASGTDAGCGVNPRVAFGSQDEPRPDGRKRQYR